MTKQTSEIEEKIEKVREDLKTNITRQYFIHFSKQDKPEFRTLAEAENWYKQQNFIAETIVGSWVDNTMAIVEGVIQDEKKKWKGEVISIIGENENPVSRGVGFTDSGLVTFDKVKMVRNDFRNELRKKLEEI